MKLRSPLLLKSSSAKRCTCAMGDGAGWDTVEVRKKKKGCVFKCSTRRRAAQCQRQQKQAHLCRARNISVEGKGELVRGIVLWRIGHTGGGTRGRWGLRQRGEKVRQITSTSKPPHVPPNQLEAVLVGVDQRPHSVGVLQVGRHARHLVGGEVIRGQRDERPGAPRGETTRWQAQNRWREEGSEAKTLMLYGCA